MLPVDQSITRSVHVTQTTVTIRLLLGAVSAVRKTQFRVGQQTVKTRAVFIYTSNIWQIWRSEREKQTTVAQVQFARRYQPISMLFRFICCLVRPRVDANDRSAASVDQLLVTISTPLDSFQLIVNSIDLDLLVVCRINFFFLQITEYANTMLGATSALISL
jgi:hypothetical protein